MRARVTPVLVMELLRPEIAALEQYGITRAALPRIEVLGDHDEPFDRRARIARIAHRDRHPVRGARERSVGVAVAQAPGAHDVRADVAVQQRCAGRSRGDRIDHRGELSVLDLDPFERVLGR